VSFLSLSPGFIFVAGGFFFSFGRLAGKATIAGFSYLFFIIIFFFSSSMSLKVACPMSNI
jgi:hypothetical protein